MKLAIYARCSTAEQHVENQLIDTTTPAGRLQIHVLSAVAQFERDRLRGMAGLSEQGRKRSATVDQYV